MVPAALEKAKDRLKAAKKASDTLASLNNLADFNTAWADFLYAFNTVSTTLEQGAKDTTESRNWIAKRCTQRKTDPLLIYLQHARNAYEHGLRPITFPAKGRVKLVDAAGAPQGYMENVVTPSISSGGFQAVLESLNGAAGTFKAVANGNAKAVKEIHFYPPQPKLAVAVDREKPYAVTTEHLGVPIVGDTLPVYSKLAIVYAEQMLTEASALKPF